MKILYILYILSILSILSKLIVLGRRDDQLWIVDDYAAPTAD